MHIDSFKTQQQIYSANNRSLNIQSFGQDNDLPQKIMEIASSSVTGRACLDTYRKFIIGRGFNDVRFSETVLNSKGVTADALLRDVCEDYATFGGFAIHVNYNALGEITSLSHVPFETIRFESLDENNQFDRLAVHPDWGQRDSRLKRFNKDDIEYFHFFDPSLDVIIRQVQESGGWAGYKGQIYYYSNAGERVYPMPIWAASLTDMCSEEGLSNITYRNVKHSFLPAGMFIDRNNPGVSDNAIEETKEELSAFQGDSNAGKIMYINLQGGDVPPEFVSFDVNNTDAEFEKAEGKTPQIIGRAFCQPPILRSEDVGSNFGSDLMCNAYDFYNAQTETERDVVSAVFAQLMELWYDHSVNPEGEYYISPKVYRVNQTLADRLGANTERVLEIILNTALHERVKRTILSNIYGLEDDEITDILEGMRNVD